VEAINYGMMRFTFVALLYFLCGLMDVTMGGLRGMGEAIAPMLISVIGVCGIRITWIYTIFQMERFHTPGWLFASYPVSWTITFLCQLIVFVLAYKKYAKRVSR
jgi:Na+-driven multidrug efflux pump